MRGAAPQFYAIFFFFQKENAGGSFVVFSSRNLSEELVGVKKDRGGVERGGVGRGREQQAVNLNPREEETGETENHAGHSVTHNTYLQHFLPPDKLTLLPDIISSLSLSFY